MFYVAFKYMPHNGLAMPSCGVCLEQCVRFGMHKAIAVFMD
jgi:hypothetical protein